MNKIIPSVIEDNGEYYIHIEEYKTLKQLVEYYEHLYSEVKKQKDDGVEYIKEHIKYECDNAFNGMQFYSYHLYDFDKKDLLRMLGEIE